MSPETPSVCPDSFALSAADGSSLAAWRWEPVGTPRGNIGIVHGLGEHSGRYAELAQCLTGAGYRVIAFDHRGHGLTAGKRGHVANYSLLLDDIACLITQLTSVGPSLPCFLYGHSLGGNLVLNYALRRQPQLAGLVISSPLLEPTAPPPLWKRAVAHMLDYVWPSLTLSTGVTTTKLFHDPDAIASRESDPLVHDRVSARLGIQMLSAGLWALKHAHELTLPCFLMHGDADKITSPAATRIFAEHVGSPSELYISAQGLHELHREADREETFRRITDFLEAHRQLA